MLVAGRAMRTIWLEDDGAGVGIIDQTVLPHALVTLTLTNLDQAAHAIRSMQVRGAPLIGAAAAYGMAARCYSQRKAGGWVTHRAEDVAEVRRLARRAATPSNRSHRSCRC